jgi:L-galactose dehydrogenase
MNGIKRRRLSKAGLEVTEIGLGGVFFSDIGADRDEGIRTVQHALKLGVNYIDTAPFYGDSQKVLGEALDGHKENYLLGTKCGRWDWQRGPYRELDAYKKQFE